jgi:hypothetical protein
MYWLLVFGMGGVQVEVEFENVNAGFAEESPLSGNGVLGHERTKFSFAGTAFAGYARNLKFRGGGRNVRVEAGAGRSH